MKVLEVALNLRERRVSSLGCWSRWAMFIKRRSESKVVGCVRLEKERARAGGPYSLNEGISPEVVGCVRLGKGRAGAGGPHLLDKGMDIFPEVVCWLT